MVEHRRVDFVAVKHHMMDFVEVQRVQRVEKHMIDFDKLVVGLFLVKDKLVG